MEIKKLEAWLSETLAPPIDGAETPRQWLAQNLPTALLGRSPLKGDSAYDLTVSMVPTYPDIVLDALERGTEIEFTFDWKKVESIWTKAIQALTSQKLRTSESIEYAIASELADHFWGGLGPDGWREEFDEWCGGVNMVPTEETDRGVSMHQLVQNIMTRLGEPYP